jgi:hypothetical protein
MGLQPGEQPKTTAAGNPTPTPDPDEAGESPTESVRFDERFGFAWVGLAWFIAAASLTGLIWMLSIMRPFASQTVNSDAMVKTLSADPRVHLVQALFYTTVAAGIAWTGLDAINRKGNLLWVLPQVFCGCIGCTWLILPLYVLKGRKN